MMMHRVVYVMLNKRSFEFFVCLDLPHNTLSRTCFLLLIVFFIFILFFIWYSFSFYLAFSRVSGGWGQSKQHNYLL